MDASLARHLLLLRASGRADDTAVLLLSDHGIHYGKYYDGAADGKREHANPLLYFLWPRKLLREKPKLEAALSANRRRLLSPFDLHATLLHVLSYPTPPVLPDWSGAQMRLRPRSLLALVPAERSCEDAGVPEDVCPCIVGEEGRGGWVGG